ncbi:LIM domain-containing protein WLIM2b-like [Alnus glutinosa]|uniref:LIM domain-containing protein WLIM2b-like n=1 Tax=Alnus glutinosa TaxID=3517 RepID=UPI002D78EE47|nr:LIM domain-containing protein WLIM2b-like [Alnus glutinosa]
MAFSGTQQKCKACDKTVHFIDMLTADGASYHKTCFKCSHCNGKLVISSYSSMDGVLYCKPHFEQLFKETGSFTKKFQTPARSQNEMNRTPSKLSFKFSGTQEKCFVCQKTVYPLEKVSMEGEFYHKKCFRCSHGGCFLTHSSYAALDGTLYCKHHFAQLFKEKGSYNHLIQTASIKKNGGTKPTPEPEAEQEAAQQQEL